MNVLSFRHPYVKSIEPWTDDEVHCWLLDQSADVSTSKQSLLDAHERRAASRLLL